MKPICVPCQRFYRPKTTGFKFIEGMPLDGAKPGKDDDSKWVPYKLWSGDMWECPGCGSQTIVGTGNAAIAVQHEPEFNNLVALFGATYKVNDC